jgi:hypothetical protein
VEGLEGVRGLRRAGAEPLHPGIGAVLNIDIALAVELTACGAR